MVARIPESERFGRLSRDQADNTRRLDDLERFDGSQYARALEKIEEFDAGLDQRVQDSISANSYTKPQIESLSWLSMVPPSKGGSGVSNAYTNQLTTGPYRILYVRSDGVFGHTDSTRASKRDVHEADIDHDAWLDLPVQRFRHKDDVAENGVSGAHWRLGFMAEDVQAAGLDWWLYISAEGELEGIAYEWIHLAHHEALRAHRDRITSLEQTVADQQAVITKLLSRVTALEEGSQHGSV